MDWNHSYRIRFFIIIPIVPLHFTGCEPKPSCCTHINLWQRMWPSVATAQIHHPTPHGAHIHSLFSINIQQALVNVSGCNSLCMDKCSDALPCEMPFGQIVPLLPSITWCQNTVGYWWERSASALYHQRLPWTAWATTINREALLSEQHWWNTRNRNYVHNKTFELSIFLVNLFIKGEQKHETSGFLTFSFWWQQCIRPVRLQCLEFLGESQHLHWRFWMQCYSFWNSSLKTVIHKGTYYQKAMSWWRLMVKWEMFLSGKIGTVEVFTSQGSSCMAQAAESKGKNWEKEDLPAVSEDHICDHLKNLQVHKCVGPNEIHPRHMRQTQLPNCYPSYLKGHGRLVKIPAIGKGET